MLMMPVVWFIRMRRFVALYRKEFSGFYTMLFVLIVFVSSILDLALNGGAMRTATGVLMFYPLLYVGWTLVRDLARHLWRGVLWCAEIIGSRMKF